MIVPLRTLQFAAAWLVTVFVLISVSLHAILERVDDDNEIDLLISSSSSGGDGRQEDLSLAGTRIHKLGGGRVNSKETASLKTVDTTRGWGKVFTGSPPSKQYVRGAGGGKKTRREIFEEKYPPNDAVRIRKAVADLRGPVPATTMSSNMTYDIHNCPATPPAGYPQEWNLAGGILRDWNPDDTAVPTRIYQGLCAFDWNVEADRTKADAYRKAELPFVLQNHPEVNKASERWSYPGYLENLVGTEPQRNEYSKTNKFMFWRLESNFHFGRRRRSRDTEPPLPPNWKPPTEIVQLSYENWMEKARKLEDATKWSRNHVDKDHWYFRLNGDWQDQTNRYLYDEMPLFIPRPLHPTMFMVEPEEHKGINCRFGMRGVTAESHYDSSRNWILLLGGQRRYILSHPNQCGNLELHPMSHPSARHSKVDWSNAMADTAPDSPFRKATANEVVLQAGDALYLPTNWFHFIVSLNINYQCNARSGTTHENDHYLHEFGMGM